MAQPIKLTRSEPEFRLDAKMAALIKGMLARGDKQSDIAACFGINGGRIAEINIGQRFAHVAAETGNLPPAGPYPSPYELWKTGRGLWRTRIALEEAQESINDAWEVIHRMEQKL
jgi:hypothetical protein